MDSFFFDRCFPNFGYFLSVVVLNVMLCLHFFVFSVDKLLQERDLTGTNLNDELKERDQFKFELVGVKLMHRFDDLISIYGFRPQAIKKMKQLFIKTKVIDHIVK